MLLLRGVWITFRLGTAEQQVLSHSSHDDAMNAVQFSQLLERCTIVVLQALPLINYERFPSRLLLENAVEVLPLAECLV